MGETELGTLAWPVISVSVRTGQSQPNLTFWKPDRNSSMSRPEQGPLWVPIAGRCRGYGQCPSAEDRGQGKTSSELSGGQSEILTGEWSQIMGEVFTICKEACAEGWEAALLPAHGMGKQLATVWPLASSSPSCCGQSGHVCRVKQEILSRISGSRDRLFFVAPFSGNRVAW